MALRMRLAAPLALLAFVLPTAARGAEEIPELARRTAVAPAVASSDTGPEEIAGGAKGKKPTEFTGGVNLTVESEQADYRVYFDRGADGAGHILERHGKDLTLLLSEGGVEQSLAKAALLPGDTELRISSHSGQIGIFAGSRLVLDAYDDRCMGGQAGVRKLSDGAFKWHAERFADAHFADDFMGKDETASTVWHKLNCSTENGDFHTASLRSPLLSANAFNYMGAGQNILSVTGLNSWDSYRYEVSLRGPVNAQIGAVFAYHDESQYGYFRWTARPVDETGVPNGPGKVELVRVRGGKEEVLAAKDVGYLPNQWYKAAVQVTFEHVDLLIDGQPILRASDPYLAAGAVGVWCNVPKPARKALDPKAQPSQINSLNDLMMQHAVFDDVLVAPAEGFEDDFRAQGELGRGWLAGAGDWRVVADGVLEARTGSAGAKSVIGNRAWSQYEVGADLDPAGGSAGLVFLYRDESNHYLARTDGRLLELLRVSEATASGKRAVPESIDRKPLKAALQPGEFLHLDAQVKRGHIMVRAGDGTTVEAFEGSGLRGRAGLFAASAGGVVRAKNFRLAFLPEAEGLVTTNAIFEDESSMSAWNSAGNEWLVTPQVQVAGQPVTLFWHRSQFPGDVDLTVEPKEITSERHEVALSVAKDGKGSNNGYVLRYQAGMPGDQGKTTWLSLQRQGKPVMDKQLDAATAKALTTLSLRRAGAYLVASVNGKPEMTWLDPEPLSGSKVAFYTSAGIKVRPESARIESDNLLNESFGRAPVEWRTAGFAIAEVTNRWQCDPRWSFFSLKNDIKRGHSAALWSKRLYPGDVTVELFAGNKMEQERGPIYTYARDMNITIGSDGSDLTKGYTFMFGGYNDTASYILRNGVKVKEFPAVLPKSKDFHHWWFFLRAERRGNRIAFKVDKYFDSLPEGELVYEDPQPLPGDRVAVWTYDHAIMISRLRISGEGGEAMEPVNLTPGPLKTVYDEKK